MNDGFGKTLRETWDMKEKAYQDFKNSRHKTYRAFLEDQLKNCKVTRARQGKRAA
ncbi:MAG: hypothetical protein PHQ23_17270 [Candidatus Wallbacteria bacterium]|nr:hypothetical protein [Candidatus Wallbacteria bacterium]